MLELARPLRDDELLTPIEVSKMTKLALRTLADKRWKGTGPDYIKLSPGRNGHVRYWRSAVLAWLNEHDDLADAA
jgi:hypothetical protein